MAGGKFSFGADAKDFQAAVKGDMIGPLQDLEKAVEKVDKADLDSLEKDFKSAQTATSKYNKELDEAVKNIKEVQRSSRSAASDARKVGDDGEAGLHKFGKAGEEVSGELKQNLGETFSSFRGDASDLAQVFQDTLGGLASGLEGIPAVAAVAAGAAGLGLVLGAIEKGNEQSEAWKESVSQLAQSLIDTGRDGGPAIDRMVDALKTLATTTNNVNLKKLSDLADQANFNFKELGQTWGGSSQDLRVLWRELDSSNDAIWENIRAAQARGDANLEEKYRGEARAALELRQEVGKQIGVTKEAEEQYKAYVAAGGPELEAKAEATKAFGDSVKSALQDAGSAFEDFNKDGTTSLDEYNQHIEEQIAATQKYQENMVTASSTLSQQALNYIESLGEDAAPLLQAYVDAPLDQKQRTAANWAQLGAAAASNYTTNLKAGIPGSVPGPVVNLTANDSALRAAINAQRGVEIPVKLVPTRGGNIPW